MSRNGNLDIHVSSDTSNGFFVCFWKLLYLSGFFKHTFEDLSKMWSY